MFFLGQLSDYTVNTLSWTTPDKIYVRLCHVAYLPQVQPSPNTSPTERPVDINTGSPGAFLYLIYSLFFQHIHHCHVCFFIILSIFFPDKRIVRDSTTEMDSFMITGIFKHVAGDFPDRRAVSVSGKFDLTYSHLHQLVEKAAYRLVAAGIKPGDVVALTFPNTIEV